ncbi:MAG: A24 family peptidase [Micrococcales bacterium]|nr:A24 family peptidase [Micrococcales bacterium]
MDLFSTGLPPLLWPVATALVVGGVASVVDLRQLRVPNAVTYPGLVATLAAAGLVGRVGSAVVGALVAGAVFMVLAWCGGVGGGDVKLGAVLGGGLGPLGWPVLAAGMLAGFVVGGVAGAAVLLAAKVFRRAHSSQEMRITTTPVRGPPPSQTRIPFAPAMTLGVLVVIVLWTVVGSVG